MFSIDVNFTVLKNAINCKNTVNDLEYGHMGIILYNRQMVIDSHDYEKLGLDYTMSHRHDVVPEISCYGVYARFFC